MFPLATRTDLHRFNNATNWVEQHRVRLSPEEADSPFRSSQVPGPIRAILLQNIWGGGTGLAKPVSRFQDRYAFKVDIAGKNVVPNSKFKLVVIGVDLKDNSTDLFTTAPIPSNSSAVDLSIILFIAAVGASLPIRRDDIQVFLGNPMSVAKPTLLSPAEQPELDTTNPNAIKSYVGSWVVKFTGNFTSNYKKIFARVVQDTEAFMRGLSSVVTQTVIDIPDGAPIILHDVYNRPADYPWKVGTLVITNYFVGIGHGIIGSDFRDMTSLPFAEVPP